MEEGFPIHLLSGLLKKDLPTMRKQQKVYPGYPKKILAGESARIIETRWG
jgi:hypothetical protein